MWSSPGSISSFESLFENLLNKPKAQARSSLISQSSAEPDGKLASLNFWKNWNFKPYLPKYKEKIEKYRFSKLSPIDTLISMNMVDYLPQFIIQYQDYHTKARNLSSLFRSNDSFCRLGSLTWQTRARLELEDWELELGSTRGKTRLRGSSHPYDMKMHSFIYTRRNLFLFSFKCLSNVKTPLIFFSKFSNWLKVK